MRKVHKTPPLPKGSIPGIIGSALAIAFLVFITICPSNMIRTLYDELDPLLREAERQPIRATGRAPPRPPEP